MNFGDVTDIRVPYNGQYVDVLRITQASTGIILWEKNTGQIDIYYHDNIPISIVYEPNESSIQKQIQVFYKASSYGQPAAFEPAFKNFDNGSTYGEFPQPLDSTVVVDGWYADDKLTREIYSTDVINPKQGELSVCAYARIGSIQQQGLCFTAVDGPATVQLQLFGTIQPEPSFEYHIDDSGWQPFQRDQQIELDAGQSMYLRSSVEYVKGVTEPRFSDFQNTYVFSMTGKIAASGNIQYLIDKTGQRTSVTEYCYQDMFADCSALTHAPELQATTLAKGCYINMFNSCTSLTQVPELPATTLTNNCYYSMFYNCTSLTSTPELPATTLANNCYKIMFEDCTKVNDIYIPNLTEAEYNAEKAAKNSGDLGREGQATFHYKESIPIPEDMLTFTADGSDSKISLNKVGEPDPISLEYYDGSWHEYVIGSEIQIPANKSIYLRASGENEYFSFDSSNYYQFSIGGKIAASGNIQYLIDKTGKIMSVPEYCFYSLFNDCYTLTQAPVLPATTLASGCYYGMFQGCASLTQAPELPATTDDSSCYANMFRSSVNLNEIKVGFRKWWIVIDSNHWVRYVSANGTFICPKELPIEFGDGRIPEGWTVNKY